MTEHDDLARNLRVLASSAPDDAFDLLPGIRRRVAARHRRRKAAMTGAASVVAVAGLSAGLGIAGRSGPQRSTTLASTGSAGGTETLLACPPPSPLSANAGTEKPVAPEEKMDTLGTDPAAGGEGTAATPEGVASAKGRAVIERSTDGAVTFRFDGEFGGDPSLATSDRAIVATVDSRTQWFAAGVESAPLAVAAGSSVALVVLDDGQGPRLALIEVDPDRKPSTVKPPMSGDQKTPVVIKGLVTSWTLDRIEIDVHGDDTRSAMTVIPDDRTETTAGGVTCAPTALPAGTPVRVEAEAIDGGTWRLVSLAY